MNSSLKILGIEGKDLIGAMMQKTIPEDQRGYIVKLKDGSYNTKKFSCAYDWSLDSIQLEQVYKKHMRNNRFCFSIGRKLYTTQVICVTFKYSYKEFNMCGKNTYVRAGYTGRDCEFNDGVCVKNGELVGIQTNIEVEQPVSAELLGNYFFFNGSYYEQRGNIPTIMDKAQIREYLYKNGFRCDGKDFVRYKRSSGSSRVGKCLFVNKVLAADMEKFDKCGLKIKDGDELDLAGFESYRALPMSSIIDTIEIQPEEILVIDDYDSTFKDEVAAVWIDDKNHLAAEEREVEVTNSIWDGQGLLDKSKFGKYENKGMILLRNRFFKSCCFNTNIQQWFADHNITRVDQLKGRTMATDISQIKFITCPSSIKYLKFGKLEDWLTTVGTTFGIVKYEKPPHPFNGKMVQAHYQLFNTLNLSYEEMEEVLKPSLDYIRAIRRDPAVLRYAIKYPINSDYFEDDDSGMLTRNEILFKLLSVNDKFAQTRMYKSFKDDYIKGEIRNLKQGHILVNGNYSTMLGNGLEMLKYVIGEFDGTSELGIGNIHTHRFEYNKELLCTRSPHVCSGNLYVVHNVAHPDYDKYFNLTDQIVCVNAIGENIQQRLNGCDYDSDTILITDHPKLIESAKKYYNFFKVPTSLVSAKKTKRYYTRDHQADLDVKTSVNKIGEI